MRQETYHIIPNTKDFYSKQVGIVDVDPEIAEVVRLLNEKGYETKASCAAHLIDGKLTSGYIWLATLPALPLPNHVHAAETSGINESEWCLRWYGSEVKSEERLKKIHTELLKWAELIADSPKVLTLNNR